MTKNRTKKQAARRRMAATGESFVQATAKHEAARVAAAGVVGYPSPLQVAGVISGTLSLDRLLRDWPEEQPAQTVDSDTSPRGVLVRLVEELILPNLDAETSDASYNLDYGFDVLEQWLGQERLKHRIPLQAGDFVRFDSPTSEEWEVKAVTERFALCVQPREERPSPFRPELRHTLVDWKGNLRGEVAFFRGHEAASPEVAHILLKEAEEITGFRWLPYGDRRELVIASFRGGAREGLTPASDGQDGTPLHSMPLSEAPTFKALTPYSLCESYSAGALSREQLLTALLAWDYIPSAAVSEGNEALVHPEGSLADLERALRQALIDSSIFDEVMDRLEAMQAGAVGTTATSALDAGTSFWQAKRAKTEADWRRVVEVAEAHMRAISAATPRPYGELMRAISADGDCDFAMARRVFDTLQSRGLATYTFGVGVIPGPLL